MTFEIINSIYYYWPIWRVWRWNCHYQSRIGTYTRSPGFIYKINQDRKYCFTRRPFYHYPEERVLDRVPTFEFNQEQTRFSRRNIDTFFEKMSAQTLDSTWFLSKFQTQKKSRLLWITLFSAVVGLPCKALKQGGWPTKNNP